MGLIERAISLYRLGISLNENCALCSANLAHAFLSIDRNVEAEGAIRRQIELIPKDDDAYFSLGTALRSQDREAEAVAAYQDALAIEPKNFQAHTFMANCLGTLGKYEEEKEHYLSAIRLRPSDVNVHLNLAVSLSSLNEMDQAEAAFRHAAALGPADARPPLNLARLLSKLYRPAEAIDSFYKAAAIDAEYFKDVKLGVGTARAQQGRLADSVVSFESAARMSPTNQKLQDSLAAMRANAKKLQVYQSTLTNAVDDICGTPCEQIVDSMSITMCDVTWEDGCGEAAPPTGFTPMSRVHELCALTCAYSRMAKEEAREEQPPVAHDEL